MFPEYDTPGVSRVSVIINPKGPKYLYSKM